MTTARKVVVGGGAALLLGVAALFSSSCTTFSPNVLEEEQPPIIVENGSVVLRPEYEESGSLGMWSPLGNNTWRYDHDNAGPARTRNSVFNGTCTGTSWRAGPVVITFGDETGTDMVIRLNVTGRALHANVGSAEARTDPNDASRLIVNLPDPDGEGPMPQPVSRLKRIAPPGANPVSYCDFNANSQPIIRLEPQAN